MIRINQTSMESLAAWMVVKKYYSNVSMMIFATAFLMEVMSPAQTLVTMDGFTANIRKDTSLDAA